MDEYPQLGGRQDRAFFGLLGGRKPDQAVKEIPVGALRQLFQGGRTLDGGRRDDGPRTREQRPSFRPRPPLGESRRDTVPGDIPPRPVGEDTLAPRPESRFPRAYGTRAGNRIEGIPRPAFLPSLIPLKEASDAAGHKPSSSAFLPPGCLSHFMNSQQLSFLADIFYSPLLPAPIFKCLKKHFGIVAAPFSDRRIQVSGIKKLTPRQRHEL